MVDIAYHAVQRYEESVFLQLRTYLVNSFCNGVGNLIELFGLEVARRGFTSSSRLNSKAAISQGDRRVYI